MNEIKNIDSNFQKYCTVCRESTEHTVKLTKRGNYYWCKCNICGEKRFNLIRNGLKK